MYPARVVLDTSAYAHLRVGHEDLSEWLAGASVVYLPVIVLGELHAGFSLGHRQRENEQTLRSFVSEAFVSIRETDRDIARRYGEIFSALRRAGTPIPTNDIWIAATTLVAGAHLITFDRHFAAIEGLPHTLLA